MDDLINRQDAIEAIVNTPSKVGYEAARYGATIRQHEILDAIKRLPSTQSERKKGQWIDIETSYADGVRQECRCSVCSRLSQRPLGDFCRWCGADMRGEKIMDERCESCKFFHKLKHNFRVGKGFDESFACDVWLHVADENGKISESAWIQETEPNAMCEMYDRRTDATDSFGLWHEIGNTEFAQCSCGFFTTRYRDYRFCPNCGKKMEGTAYYGAF